VRAEEAATAEAGAEDKAVRALVLNDTEKAVAAEKRERRQEQHDLSNLRAQRFTAGAGGLQVVVGAIGLAGLFYTVLYARKAWQATARSAKADEESLAEMRAESERQRARYTQQLEAAERDAKIQSERFDNEIAEAKRAADTAEASAKDTSFISRNQSRAYVHVAGARLDYTQEKGLLGGDGYRPKVFINLTNVGATPTKYVGTQVVGSLESFTGVYTGYREVQHDTLYETANVAPKDSVEIKVWVDGLENLVATAKKASDDRVPMSEPRYFAIRGRLVYRDVFDREHFTDFGFYIYAPEPGESQPMLAMTDNFARYESYPPQRQIGLPRLGRSPMISTRE
jgi:hypothetical protein